MFLVGNQGWGVEKSTWRKLSRELLEALYIMPSILANTHRCFPAPTLPLSYVQLTNHCSFIPGDRNRRASAKKGK